MAFMITMLLILLRTHDSAAVIHSLYFYTASSQIPHIPEFQGVGLVNGVQMVFFDSETQKVIRRQSWMDKVSEEDPGYWDYQTQLFMGTQFSLMTNLETAKQRFHQSEGVHVIQNTCGCEWDDETGDVKGFQQFGYDGKDFIAFDLKTETWTAAKQQAVRTKNKWENDRFLIQQQKNYLTQICPVWLKKYVNYGRSSLRRTVLPSLSLLQKSSSSPVSCHATGFYPNRAEMFWRKDGEEIHEGVEKGEILPNNDGTFQMSADLLSVPDEDWTRFECVFRLSAEENDLVTSVEKPMIRTNEGSSNMVNGAIIIALAFLFIIIAAITFILYYRKNEKPPPSAGPAAEIQEKPDRNETNTKNTNIPTEELEDVSETPSDGSASLQEPLSPSQQADINIGLLKDFRKQWI